MVAKIKNLLLANGDANLEVKLEICYSNKDRCSYFIYMQRASFSRCCCIFNNVFFFQFFKYNSWKAWIRFRNWTVLGSIKTERTGSLLFCLSSSNRSAWRATCLWPTSTVRNKFFELHFVSNTAPLCRTEGAHMRCSQTCACVLVVPRLLGTSDLYRNDR